jgi:hypothetical protein
MLKEFTRSLNKLEGNLTKPIAKELIKELKSSTKELNSLIGYKSNENKIIQIIALIKNIEKSHQENRIADAFTSISKIKDLTNQLQIQSETKLLTKKLKLPEEIKDEIFADIEELEKCFSASCYRSSIILCARILETALHRKYYELTKNDLLEKSPGIGLGKIIAKLKEKEIKFDPGITQQIHLINQMRIFTVHKKKERFNPTKSQTHAMILYTTDILEKLFK